MEEARERSNEITDAIDTALAQRVISHKGKHFAFSNLRLLPRTFQRPSPPRWTTVVSADSARRAARRGLKISTGFNSVETIKTIFDAYRDEAKAAGLPAGPDCLALRRRVTVGATPDQARTYGSAVAERLKSYVAQDSRVTQHVPDSPAKSGSFTVSDDEFITGTPKQVASQIIEQCRAVGAGHFLTVLNWGAPVDEVAQAHEAFGREAIPLLRAAAV
jgi:alkanesulfonate monooxygenase SsuD/methylene tetrahydromethanopterin reductase-like flavin-dependent oxidoreductase (luciferase family)